MKVLELFAGTRSIGKAFEAKGHEVFSVEWDKDFENIDLYADISKVTAEEIIEKFGKPDVIWASPDCATFSIAAISHHRRKNQDTGNLDPVSDYAKFCDEVDQHVLQLIRELNPSFYFIENPRGGMRKMVWMKDIPRYTVTYCQYGDTRMKPTDIWTNHPDPQFKPMCKNGDPCHEKAPRGSRTGTQGLNGSKKRSVIPEALCQHIVDICEKYIQEKEKKTMELKMNAYQLPEKISFNFEELKQELTEKVSMYETLVYTDDQIKEAKADKEQLNKLKKALNDERIRLEKEYMVPFNSFKAQINEIISIIDKPVALIDKQVKEYEDKQKQDKMEQIKALWSEMDVPEGLTLEEVFEDRMLNVSYGMNHVKQKMLDDIKRFNRDMETLAALPEFGFEAQQEYIRTLDLNKALAEGQRMAQIAKAKAEREEAMRKIEEEQKAKAAAEAQAKPECFGKFTDTDKCEENIGCKYVEECRTEAEIEAPAQPARQWISFAALLTVGEAMELKNFFNTHGIEYKAI